MRRGPRRTTHLTPRAVRRIKGAALKAVNMGRPLRAFITFTIREQDRERFESGEFTLGHEIKRTINAFNGWRRRRELPPIAYVWVAENVGNANPHVHMLADYAVPRREFDAFARHLESLWGWGFSKIERIKKPASAARYILKALGYTMKGATEDQGAVIGNRYGIAREIMPHYELIDLHGCEDAARAVAELTVEAGEQPEEIAEGVWLTRYGLACVAGTSPERIARLVEELAEHWRETRDE